jgi:hypothetical protein
MLVMVKDMKRPTDFYVNQIGFKMTRNAARQRAFIHGVSSRYCIGNGAKGWASADRPHRI